MQFENITSKRYLNYLFLQHNATSLVWIALFACILLVVQPISRAEAMSLEMNISRLNLLIILLSSFAFVGFVLGEYLSRKIIDNAKNKILLSEKAKGYFKAKRVRYIMLSLPILMAMSFYIVAPIRGIMILTFAVIALLAVNYPSKSRMIQELGLSDREKKIIHNPEKKLGDQTLNNF